MPYRLGFMLNGPTLKNPLRHTRAFQSCAYEWIRAAAEKDPDADYGTLHDKNEYKPFTIAPIVREHTDTMGSVAPSPAASTVFEVTLLDETYKNLICSEFRDGAAIRLDTVSYPVSLDYLTTRSWKSFIDQATTAISWRIRLLTPTACKQSGTREVKGRVPGRTVPLPLPVNYFASWCYKWTKFSPLPLGGETQLTTDELLAFVNERVEVLAFEGRGFRYNAAPSRIFPSFTGSVEFAVSWPEPDDAPFLKALDSLTMFAEYSATGIQTTAGMGQTRVERVSTLKPHQEPDKTMDKETFE